MQNACRKFLVFAEPKAPYNTFCHSSIVLITSLRPLDEDMLVFRVAEERRGTVERRGRGSALRAAGGEAEEVGQKAEGSQQDQVEVPPGGHENDPGNSEDNVNNCSSVLCGFQS